MERARREEREKKREMKVWKRGRESSQREREEGFEQGKRGSK